MGEGEFLEGGHGRASGRGWRGRIVPQRKQGCLGMEHAGCSSASG
ncbi:hypothetical protein PCLA_18f0119 [Pseudomonas citronellolis]|nr:hypothetical protein PCLA_18f0119 [Pseudomonas citronellolis]